MQTQTLSVSTQVQAPAPEAHPLRATIAAAQAELDAAQEAVTALEEAGLDELPEYEIAVLRVDAAEQTLEDVVEAYTSAPIEVSLADCEDSDPDALSYYVSLDVEHDGRSYRVGCMVGAPESTHGSVRASGAGVRPFCTAWWSDRSDWQTIDAGQPTDMCGPVLDAISEAAWALYSEAADGIAAELVGRIEEAASAAEGQWEGWDWAHDPGGEVVTGPGAVNDWDAWEEERREELEAALPTEADEDGDRAIGEPDHAAQAAAERKYGEQCQADAEAAAELAAECVEAAQGHDFAKALELAKRAARLESEYGDDPTYRALVDACEVQ